MLKWIKNIFKNNPNGDFKSLLATKDNLEGEEYQEAIIWLTENYLIDRERRNDSGSILYKDPHDNHLWQLFDSGKNWHGANRLILSLVTDAQWQHKYIERKFGKTHQQKDWREQDLEFYEMLEDDDQGEECAENGCHQRKIKYSSLCKDHHFEYITGRKVNFKIKKET